MKTISICLSICLMFIFNNAFAQIPPTVKSGRNATAREKEIFKDLPRLFEEDQLLRGEPTDITIELKGQLKDSTQKAKLHYLTGQLLDIQEQYFDHYMINSLLKMIDQGGFFNGFVYGRDTLNTTILLLHIPMGEKDSLQRKAVKRMLDKEYKAERLGMTPYAVTLWQLNTRKGSFKDYFSKEYIANPRDKNKMYFLRME